MIRRGTRFLFAAILVGVGCAREPGDGSSAADSEVVIGKDDRTEVHAHPDESLRDVARRSIVAMVKTSALDFRDPKRATYASKTLGEAEKLCPGERFAEQPTVSDCSGSLIGDDLVLTAGHCFEDDPKKGKEVTPQEVCARSSFVFGYYYDEPKKLHPIAKEATFACKEILVEQNDDGDKEGIILDHAIVRLDRKATPMFEPLKIRSGRSPVVKGQELAVIGAPSGIPLKIDSGGAVLDPRSSGMDWFAATTDTFSGSSGSSVIDRKTHEVLGILVRGGGTDDYVKKGKCNVPMRCPAGGCVVDGKVVGEEVSYVHRVVDALCEKIPDASLCAASVPAGPSGSGEPGEPEAPEEPRGGDDDAQ